jgi:hypothetical protein
MRILDLSIITLAEQKKEKIAVSRETVEAQGASSLIETLRLVWLVLRHSSS